MARARDVRGLSCDEPFRTAAGKILWTRFDELMSYREDVLKIKDKAVAEELVHDMRVASRRLRAAMEVFVDVFPRRSYRGMLKNVKLLADSLGEIRDIDVLVKRLDSSRKGKPVAQRVVLDSMVAELEAQRKAARDRLEATIVDLEKTDFPRRFAVFVARETV